jgi:hypothetical protein
MSLKEAKKYFFSPIFNFRKKEIKKKAIYRYLQISSYNSKLADHLLSG